MEPHGTMAVPPTVLSANDNTGFGLQGHYISCGEVGARRGKDKGSRAATEDPLQGRGIESACAVKREGRLSCFAMVGEPCCPCGTPKQSACQDGGNR